jgi:prepilin-type N-terminal cleavage/methylation domain-containing protein
VVRAQRGYSLLEMSMTVAIFAVLIMIVVALENQMIRFDRAFKIRFMVHPEEMAVIARVRKDVLDAQGYPAQIGGYVQSPTTLILGHRDEKNRLEQVVYDFSTSGLVRRSRFHQNTKLEEWVGRGLPRFEISSFEMPNEEIAVRLRGFDKRGELVVDQILLPRGR